MGILDDAIREHLDLKRRRGADPAEIERAEREALGPVRRGPEAGPVHIPGDHLATEPDDVEYDDEGFEEHADYYEEAPDEAPFGHVQPPADVPPAPPGPADEDDPFGDHAEEPFDEFATREHPGEHDPEPAAVHDPEPDLRKPARDPLPPEPDSGHDEPASHAGQETAEYDVEQELDKDPDDVLEETPEFLQDTPDHDRLWFEQRPPKDFDFDG